MINVNEIIKKHNPDYVLHGANVMHSSKILASVKEIVEEVLKKATNKVELTKFAYEFLQENAFEATNKQLILDVAKQVKYD